MAMTGKKHNPTIVKLGLMTDLKVTWPHGFLFIDGDLVLQHYFETNFTSICLGLFIFSVNDTQVFITFTLW